MPIKLNKRPDIITSFPFYVDKKEISFAILPFFASIFSLGAFGACYPPQYCRNKLFLHDKRIMGLVQLPFCLFFNYFFSTMCFFFFFFFDPPPSQSKNFLLLATNSSPSQSGEVNFDFGDTAHCNNMQSPQATTKTNYTFRKKKTTKRIYI